jgi:hypothetical protein
MIRYVQSVASQQVPPPYHFPGVTVNAFLWDAPVGKIQAYCDRYFNLGEAAERGFVYRPAAFWPFVALLIIDYPIMVSSDRSRTDIGSTPFPDRGYMSQKEAFVVAPVLRSGTLPETMVLKMAMEWALPFIVVDNPMSAVCGREMLGLEKLLGNIEFGESDFPDSFKGRIHLPGWASLKPGEMQTKLKFLEVDTGPTLPTYRGSPAEDSVWTLLRSDTASKAISALGTAKDFMETVSLGFLSSGMRTVSLKQFRDAAYPSKALYQALVSCRSTYSSVRNFRFYNEQDVNITFYDHGSFDHILKVFIHHSPNDPPREAGDRRVRVKPVAAFRFNANIDFDDMRTLHTFAVAPGEHLPPCDTTDDMLAPWLRPIRGFFSGSPP